MKARVARAAGGRPASAGSRPRASSPRLRVLLTGATGFLGKEILAQAAADPHVEEVVCGRPPGDDPRPQDEGGREGALRPRAGRAPARSGCTSPARRRGSSASWRGTSRSRASASPPRELERLATTLTHVIHCAASVSFDDTYENSFRANVLGCRNALAFSQAPAGAPGSPFVSPRGDRDLVHPRPAQALDRPGGRARLPRGTSTTTSTSSRRPWPRSRPTGPWSRTACG